MPYPKLASFHTQYFTIHNISRFIVCMNHNCDKYLYHVENELRRIKIDRTTAFRLFDNYFKQLIINEYFYLRYPWTFDLLIEYIWFMVLLHPSTRRQESCAFIFHNVSNFYDSFRIVWVLLSALSYFIPSVILCDNIIRTLKWKSY